MTKRAQSYTLPSVGQVERLLKEAQDILAEATVLYGSSGHDGVVSRRFEEVHDCVADAREILQRTRMFI